MVPAVPVALHTSEWYRQSQLHCMPIGTGSPSCTAASHAGPPKINFKFFAKTHPSHGMKIQPECSVFPLLHFPSSQFPTVFYLAGGQCQETFRAADFPAPCQRRRDKISDPNCLPHPHGADSYSLASHRGGPGSIPGKSTSDV